MQVNTIVEKLMFCTVRITTVGPGGTGLGTGFLFHKVDPTDPTQAQVWVVTNKHVVDGATDATLHFMAAQPGGGAPVLGQEIPVTLPAASFVGHSDPQVDVAMAPVGGLLQQLIAAGSPAYFQMVGESECATNTSLEDEFEPIEPVTFIGYPNGLYDSASLLPIVRRGHSATSLSIDYEGKPIFLVDASVFPGSSGSPVFIVVPPSGGDKFGNIMVGGGARVVFLGVVAAVYQRSVPVLTAGGGAPFVHDALDIGIVYKASTVLELANSF